ncbi:adenosylcobinamide amidohydrolase [Halobacteriales archaeon QS_4_69_225]|nr:MAG: adenosylcobinamide amidohydrolase [Halobacteriales archaeon QS_4_69_225]
MTFEYDRTDDRLTLRRPGTRWLSNAAVPVGQDGGDGEATDRPGGAVTADAAYNLTVPEGFQRTDLAAYVAERLGSPVSAPVLLTGVSQRHARGARRRSVAAVVTAGLSNPATLPMPGEGSEGTTRNLVAGAQVGLLATAVEAKTATLSATVGVTGTSSDAVVVGCDPAGETTRFAGSATAVGAAARVCVREALRASLASRYAGEPVPDPSSAEHGVSTEETATVFEP